MHFSTAVAGSLFLAGQAVSLSPIKVAHNIAESLHHRSFDVEAQMSDNVYDFIDNLEKRQGITAPSSTSSSSASTPTVSSTPASGNASDFNLEQWNEMTAPSCLNAVQALNGNAGNPSGMAVCYNVPFLDNTTGVFMSEVRLYSVMTPVNEWAGIDSSAINVSLTYLGANSAPAQIPSTMTKRDDISKRQSSTTPASTQVFVGTIETTILVNGIKVEQLPNLLVPNITLHAISPQTSQMVSTNVSSSDATFNSGLYSGVSTTGTNPEAIASASAVALAATPFQLPGATFRIPLIGFIVTLIWTGLFIITVGLGTVGRVQFRDQYRKNLKTDSMRGISRI